MDRAMDADAPGGGSGAAGGAADLPARWQAAEERLYPVVMVRPEGYQIAVTLVRAIADRLQEVTSVAALVAAYADAAAMVADAVRETAVVTAGLDLGLVAGAAFNLRHRELLADLQREQAKERIAAARAAGEPWVLLFEAGRAEFAAVSPYRRLEMRVADGYGLHAAISPDPGAAGLAYTVEAVQLDPVTGDWLSDGPATEPLRLDSREQWLAALERMRAGP